MQKFNYSYDKENDDLFLCRSNSKSKGSVEFGDLIIDYNAKKELVGIQIINASKLIQDISNKTFSEIKNTLNNLTSCKIDIKSRNNILVIKLNLSSASKEISSVISIPSIIKSSPALAYV